MTSRERILKTLNHEEPDRVPRDLGGSESSRMTAVRSADGDIVARRPKGGYYFDPVNPPMYDVTDPAEWIPKQC